MQRCAYLILLAGLWPGSRAAAFASRLRGRRLSDVVEAICLAFDSNFLDDKYCSIPAGISARSPPTGNFSCGSTYAFDALSEKACCRSAFGHWFLELVDFLFTASPPSVLSRELLSPPIAHGGDGTLNAVTPIRCGAVAIKP